MLLVSFSIVLCWIFVPSCVHFDLGTCTCVENFLHMSVLSHACSLTHMYAWTLKLHLSLSLSLSLSHTHTHSHTQITHQSTKMLSRSLLEGEPSPTHSSMENQLADVMTSLPSTQVASWLNFSCRGSRPETPQILTIPMITTL